MTAAAVTTSFDSRTLKRGVRWPLADESWHDCTSADHLLLALLGDEKVRAALQACGASPDGLRETLLARSGPASFPSLPRRLLRRFGVGLLAARSSDEMEVQRVVRRAMIRAQCSHKRPVAATDLFVSLIDEGGPKVSELLREHGVARYDALNFVSHGIAKAEAAPAGAGAEKGGEEGALCGVVIYNDHFTPMEFVVRTLESVFGLSYEDAARTMLRIHEVGSAVVGVYDRAEALAKAEAVTTFARDHQFALRCVVDHTRSEGERPHAELLT